MRKRATGMSRNARGPTIEGKSTFRLTASAKATASLADQPPLKLRRSAGALAKAEAPHAKAEGGSCRRRYPDRRCALQILQWRHPPHAFCPTKPRDRPAASRLQSEGVVRFLPSKPVHRQRGSALLEALIAMAIVIAALTGVAQLLLAS